MNGGRKGAVMADAMKKLFAGLCLAASRAAWTAPPATAWADEETPMKIKDVLAGCRELASTGPVELPKAADIAQSCLDNIYGQRSYAVTAREGTIYVSTGRWTPEGLMEGGGPTLVVKGILITVRGPIPAGDPVLDDLQRAVNLRGRRGKLLGWSASVRWEKR